MPSSLYDLRFIQAGLEEIETYLVSKTLFYPLNILSPPGEPSNPRLTLGNFLLALVRLQTRELSRNQDAQILSLNTAVDRWRTSWRVAWKKKAKREFHSRLRQWKLYLYETINAPHNHIAFYPSEVRVRVMIELLKAEIDPPESSVLDGLEILDQTLMAVHLSGEFIWDSDLSPGFSPETYWYLWGKPNIDLFTPGKSSGIH